MGVWAARAALGAAALVGLVLLVGGYALATFEDNGEPILDAASRLAFAAVALCGVGLTVFAGTSLRDAHAARRAPVALASAVALAGGAVLAFLLAGN